MAPEKKSSSWTSQFHPYLPFQNQRNSSLIAYFKSSFKATGRDFWPHCSLSGTVHCPRATQIHSCNRKETLNKQSLVFSVTHTNYLLWGLPHYQDDCTTESSEQCYKPVNNLPSTRRTSRTSTDLTEKGKWQIFPWHNLKVKRKILYFTQILYLTLLCLLWFN